MKIKYILSLMTIILVSIPLSGWGQALFDVNKVKYDPSKLFPILSASDIVGAPDDAIPLAAIKAINDRCMSRVPSRFTPSAHENYCTCSAAATQGTITVGELRDLQKETNRVLGNKTFEKYVTNVVKPCMEIPIQQIEYMFCISSTQNDWRIRLPIPYCKCVSRGVQKNFEKHGLENMMIGWGTGQKMGDQDPIDTLWENNVFLKSRSQIKDKCVGSYMHPSYFK